MLNIISCYKWVIDEAYIRKTPSGGLDFSTIDYKIGEYDRNAIEEAVRLKEAHGGKVTALTAGVPESSKGVKDALSRGCDQACFAADASFRDLEPSQTASVLANAIKAKLEYNLIICGEGSSDLYTQQVGPILAENLGIPCATYVNKLEVAESEKLIRADRKLDDCVEVVSIKLPALVTVLPDINTPRIPTLKQVLAAGKKPVENITLDALGGACESCLQTTGIVAATMERRRLKFGTESDDIRALIGALLKDGVIA